MKEVAFTINYGGYIGCEEEYTILVDDDATDEQIEDAIWDEFEERIRENCYWERND